MSSIVRPVRSSSRWVASIGPVSISTGSTPTRQVSTIAGHGREAELARPSPRSSAARRRRRRRSATSCRRCARRPRGRPASASPASRASSRAGPRRGRPCASCRSACRPRRGRAPRSGTIWPSKRSSAHARAARSWDAQPERVGVVAGDAPLVGDALGALELRRHLVAAEVGLAGSGCRGRAPWRVGADRDPAHRLDAAGDGDVDDARRRRATTARLVACWRRPALGVDGGGGDRRAGGRRRATRCG